MADSTAPHGAAGAAAAGGGSSGAAAVPVSDQIPIAPAGAAENEVVSPGLVQLASRRAMIPSLLASKFLRFGYGPVSSLFGRDGVILSGDGLLAYVLQETQASAGLSFQTLPVIYAIERWLTLLRDIGMQYRIFFFDNWEASWAGPWRLLRRVVIGHLQGIPNLVVDCIPSSYGPEWTAYCNAYSSGSFMVKLSGWTPLASMRISVLASALAWRLLLMRRSVVLLGGSSPEGQMTMAEGELAAFYVHPVWSLNLRRAAVVSVTAFEGLDASVSRAVISPAEPAAPTTWLQTATTAIEHFVQDVQHDAESQQRARVALAFMVSVVAARALRLHERAAATLGVPLESLSAAEQGLSIGARLPELWTQLVGALHTALAAANVQDPLLVDAVDLRLARHALIQTAAAADDHVWPAVQALTGPAFGLFAQHWRSLCTVCPVCEHVFGRVPDAPAPPASAAGVAAASTTGSSSTAVARTAQPSTGIETFIRELQVPVRPEDVVVASHPLVDIRNVAAVHSGQQDWLARPLSQRTIDRYRGARAHDDYHWHNGRPVDDEFAGFARESQGYSASQQLRWEQRKTALLNIQAEAMIGGPIQRQVITETAGAAGGASAAAGTVSSATGETGGRQKYKPAPAAGKSKADKLREDNNNEKISKQLAAIKATIDTLEAEVAKDPVSVYAKVQRECPVSIVESKDEMVLSIGDFTSSSPVLVVDGAACNVRLLQVALSALRKQWSGLRGKYAASKQAAVNMYRALCHAYELVRLATLTLDLQEEAAAPVKGSKSKKGAAAAPAAASPALVTARTGLAKQLGALAIIVLSSIKLFAFDDEELASSFLQLLPTEVRELKAVTKAVTAPLEAASGVTVKDALAETRVLGRKLRRWDPVAFQMIHMGAELARPDGSPDPRIHTFRPDDWQRQLLDLVDDGKSALVIAPTSSGKTFISYYIMERVLRTDSDGLVLYVAPTKALVHQVYSEIYARFDKTFSNRGAASHVGGIFTREDRMHMHNCQILVTVPACAGIIMMSAARSSAKLRKRLRYAIFDEVHNIIGDDGAVWEQLLASVPCPFLALSATIGNPLEFADWLNALEHERGRECHLIQHNERYNDLVYQQWLPSIGENASTSGVDESKAVEGRFVPICSSVRLPDLCRPAAPQLSIQLLPGECVALYEQFTTLRGQLRELSPELAAQLQQLEPKTWFKAVEGASGKLAIIRKTSVTQYSHELVSFLSKFAQQQPQLAIQPASNFTDSTQLVLNHMEDVLGRVESYALLNQTMLPLLRSLAKEERLPAIVFQMDPRRGQALLEVMLEQLEAEEYADRQATGSAARAAQLEAELAEATAILEKARAHMKKTDGPEIAMQAEAVRSMKQRLLQFHRPDPRFAFPGRSGLPSEDTIRKAFNATGRKKWVELQGKLRNRPQYRALLRGIGLHAATLSFEYRAAVEYLFRTGELQVVIATATLAQGIHMPCRTVVFTENHVHFNALQFRQMSGRAGRRNFDNEGNVVFAAVPPYKTRYLLSCTAPPLIRCATLSTADVLRLTLLYTAASSDDADAVAQRRSVLDAAQRLLHCSFQAHSNAAVGKLNTAHIGFVLQFLAQVDMLRTDDEGRLVLTSLSHLVAHLFYTNAAAFVFVGMLHSGLLDLLVDSAANEQERDVRLLAVCSMLFQRKPLHPAVLRHKTVYAVSKVRFRSNDVDPAFPAYVKQYNAGVLRLFTGHLRNYVQANGIASPEELPLSRVSTSPYSTAEAVVDGSLRSRFLALDGRPEEFASIERLFADTRADLFIDVAAVPVLEDVGVLNRYMLDFYQHGQLIALIRDNGMKEADAYNAIKDFALLLKVIYVALRKSGSAAPPAVPGAGGPDADAADQKDDGADSDAESMQSEHSDVVGGPVRVVHESDHVAAAFEGLAARLLEKLHAINHVEY